VVVLNKLLDAIGFIELRVDEALAVDDAGAGLDMNKLNKSSLVLLVFEVVAAVVVEVVVVVIFVFGAPWNDWKSVKSSKLLLLFEAVGFSNDWKSAHSSSLDVLLVALLDEAGSSKSKSNKLVSLTADSLFSLEEEVDAFWEAAALAAAA